MKIFIIVPIYNEGQRAVETIKRILKSSKCRIIAVDDGSIDNSCQLLKKAFRENKQIEIIKHVINLGKGAAMKTGAEMAWKSGAEAIIFIDADGQHNPKYLPEFETALKNNKLVFGYRELGNKMPFMRRQGNKLAKWLVEVIFKIKRKDLLCGFLGFRKSIYNQIKWRSPRYGIETEMATRVGKNKLAFSEIKIDTIYIDKYKGVTLFDALWILLKIPFWYIER